jgi:uncharacterized protein (TIGR03435 family)
VAASIEEASDMQIIADPIRRCRKLALSTAGIVAVAIASTFGLLGSTPTQAPPQQQSTTASASAYEFETASIKLNQVRQISFRAGFTVDGYRTQCASLQSLIREAYGVQGYEISEIPKSLNTECYDIEAKMDQSVADALSKLTPAELKLARQQMLQSLLAERFNLKIHRETKDAPVYFLTVGKNGPKLPDAKTDDTRGFLNADGSAARYRIQTGIAPESGGVEKTYAYSTSMKNLGDWLTTRLSRPVLDKTGLTGAYDFNLDWVPDSAASAPTPDAQSAVTLPGIPGASLFTALQQQLGLKLEPGKAPIEIVVIDHVERPSGN